MTTSLSVIGRFGVNIAYNSGAQYAAELIPTEVRGQGVALVHVAGYAATFFSPYVLYLVRTKPSETDAPDFTLSEPRETQPKLIFKFKCSVIQSCEALRCGVATCRS
jgi:hypothetical protein